MPAGAGRARRVPWCAAQLERQAEQAYRPVATRLVEFDHHLPGAHELGVERLVEIEQRLEAAVVLRGERLPLVAGALEEDPLHLGVRLRARRVVLVLEQVLAPHSATPRLPELRLQRAERDPAVAAGV